MAHQTTVGNGRLDHDAPTKAVARGVGELGADILQLAELQAQLAKEDLAVTARGMVKPAICVAVSAVFAVASLPIVLVAVAELIVQYTELTRGWSYLIVSLATLVTSLAAIFASRGMFQGFSTFDRSRQELTNNLQWLKTMWKKPSKRPAPSESTLADRATSSPLGRKS